MASIRWMKMLPLFGLFACFLWLDSLSHFLLHSFSSFPDIKFWVSTPSALNPKKRKELLYSLPLCCTSALSFISQRKYSPNKKKKVTFLVRKCDTSHDRFSFWFSDAAFNGGTGIFGVWTQVWNEVQLLELTIRGFRNDKYSPLNHRINPENYKFNEVEWFWASCWTHVVSLSSQHISW